MVDLITNSDYKNWLFDLKLKIKQSQIKAALAINSELILMYWELGKQIAEKQLNTKWGSGFIEQLSNDLKSEFPQMSGFSVSNIYETMKFYKYFSQNESVFHQFGGQLPTIGSDNTKDLNFHQVGGNLVGHKYIRNFCVKIPWRHIVLILQKCNTTDAVHFYIEKTIENNWSRSILEYQIETNLQKRQGKAISNFKYTLPEMESDLAQQLLKDPYNFEFLSLSTEAKEKDLEQKLIQHITQFLLELGKGFAYLGKQFSLKVGRKDYRIDLLFYHIQLKSYIVIELKMKEFEPEFIGKLNFYISAINELVKTENDNPTIGILLCKNKDNFEVEFALKDINNPIGVSEFKYAAHPENVKKALPTLEEFENELKKIHNE